MRPHPSLNAMLLCDHTIREQGTGKVSLIGAFENISAAHFPLVHRAPSVYLHGRAGRGGAGRAVIHPGPGAPCAS